MAWAGNAHRTIYERKQVVLRFYLSNFSSEHTTELGLGQGIRLLACLGAKSSGVAMPHRILMYYAPVLVCPILHRLTDLLDLLDLYLPFCYSSSCRHTPRTLPSVQLSHLLALLTYCIRQRLAGSLDNQPLTAIHA